MTQQFFNTFLGILAALVVLLGFTRLLGPLPLSISQTTTNKASTFDVSGQAEVTTAPDRAEITAGIQVNENTVAAAQDKGNTIIKQITQDIQKLGVAKEDIKTVNYSLYPNYDFRGSSQKITGYNLNINLKITIKDFNKMNDVIDTATRDGANQVGGVSFTLSDDKRREVENQARELAIERAKEKAESLARIAGIKLGKIIDVMENPRQIPYLAKDLAVTAGGPERLAAPTEVSPGSTTFSMTVTLSYETN